MKICVLFDIPPKIKVKHENWVDGFTGAIDIMRATHEIDMINTHNNDHVDVSSYDVVIFKEGFRCNIQKRYIDKVDGIKVLCVSTSKIKPSDSDLKTFDILFYETQWYYDYANLSRHPHAYHAFGVDTSIMKPMNLEPIYDVIFVGTIIGHKRPIKMLDLKGNKICIGAIWNKGLAQRLIGNGIEVKEFLPYSDLAEYYNRSRLCYVPCTIHGGGERAVLEARACGVPVKIEPDNPKLSELLESPIYSSEYYAKQLEYGLLMFSSKRDSNTKE